MGDEAERRFLKIADRIVPQYRNGTRTYSCGSHTAKLWEAAYEGAKLMASEQRIHSTPGINP